MLIFLFFLFNPLHADELDLTNRRIQSHFIIKDFYSAYEEALNGIRQFPESESMHESYIKSLARIGDEKEMLRAWNRYVQKFPEKSKNRELIEEMCWGVLQKASSSRFLLTRLGSLLGAYFSQDSRGVEMLKQGLRDPNVSIRGTAVMIVSHLRDSKLIEEIKRLYRVEKVWDVRKVLVEAIGSMKIRELQGELETLVASEWTLAEEKVLAIKSLVNLLDEQQMKRESVMQLASSNRAGLRLLATKVIAHFQFSRDEDLLLKLVHDHHAEVRASALQSLGITRKDKEKIIQIAKDKLKDSDPIVAISASWLLTVLDQNEGREHFEKVLQDPRKSVRILAAGALSMTGIHGIEVMQKMIHLPDPFVRLNLALGLVGQRVDTEMAANILQKVSSNYDDKWDWQEEGIFKSVCPKKRGDDEITELEMNNQLVRLEILNTLSIIAPEKAQESIRKFLLQRAWGISGAAAGLLLMEGDETAVQVVQALLKDENLRVRVQAALVLSLWSRDEGAISVLEKSYWEVDNEMKGKILEGIARIGSMSSVPFLIHVLEEPSPFLRIIGATALIQCLNH